MDSGYWFIKRSSDERLPRGDRRGGENLGFLENKEEGSMGANEEKNMGEKRSLDSPLLCTHPGKSERIRGKEIIQKPCANIRQGRLEQKKEDFGIPSSSRGPQGILRA